MQKVIKAIKDCVASKTCCEETGVDCNQGRACPVREGTHKPAEAVHQIKEPLKITAIDALREAEAALEVAMARILKADPSHSICVTSEAKALVAVRAALAAPAPMLVAQPQLHAALFAARGALQHMKEGGKPTQSLLNEAIAAIDSVAVTQAAPAAVAVPDAVRDAEKLLRAEAARLARIYGSNKWYGFSAEKESYLEHLRAAAALAATPAADAQKAMPWLQVVDEEMVLAHIGVAEASDDYATAKDKINRLICWHIDVAKYNERAAAAPVVLPEPDDSEFEQQLPIQPIGVMGGGEARKVLWNCTFMPEAGTSFYTEQQVRALLATGGQAQAVEQEPFGYFKAEPFGWTDCGPDDEGAVALYERPQAQADARDADDADLIEWLSGQYLAADFHWGEPKTPVLVIEIPATASVCGDFRTDVRAAIAIAAAKGE